MLNRKTLEERLDEVLCEEVERFVASVPYAKHLTDDTQELNEEYYLRHRIETIWRIRMTSKTDALALARMVDEDYEAARSWARYTVQEMNHDLLFLKDLRAHGYTFEGFASVGPFDSTRALLSYLTDRIEADGSIAAVAYSIFVEWNSERYSSKAVSKAEKRFSRRHVTGSGAHVGIDEDQDHYSMMLDIAHRLLEGDCREEVLFQMIRDISALFRQYFCELYEATAGRHSGLAKLTASPTTAAI